MAEKDGGQAEEWMTVPALVQRLGWPMSDDSVGRMIARGDLPAVQARKGATRYVKLSDARAFEANGFRKVEPDQDTRSASITPPAPATRS